MNNHDCFHCGIEHKNSITILFQEKNFCCNGCKTVFELFSDNDLTSYYDLENSPGKIPETIQGKYDYLTNEKIVEKLLEFEDEQTAIISLHIPYIHCSSCIWILENLQRLNPSITSSQVNFPKKTVRIIYKKEETELKSIIELLSSIGYVPYISLENVEKDKLRKKDRSLIYKIAIAGFAFGNSMFISFPEYFEVDEFWLDQYKSLFRWLLFLFSLPVVFYSAQHYFVSAIKGLSKRILNIDVPISLGIAVLFIRSTVEVIFDFGQGYFDSLSGLVFFLLLGKFFQQSTYNHLSFERDYKSYFPIAVTKINDQKEESIPIQDVQKGDRLLIRNQELIPIDGIMIQGSGLIDYSFVTGEANPISKNSGDKIFAGGKQLGGIIEIEAIKTVSQSYLTQLWSNDAFAKQKNINFKNITDTISKNFTMAILLIALVSGTYWVFIDSYKAVNVITAVLIIACPCAIALSAPFTLGNMLRIFGKHKFYLKNAEVIENIAKVDSIIFDKTGTITSTVQQKIVYKGEELSSTERMYIAMLLKNSNHPLSRMLHEHLNVDSDIQLSDFKETPGKGIEGTIDNLSFKLGSKNFVNSQIENTPDTAVFIAIDEIPKGVFIFQNNYRKDISKVFNELCSNYNISILSGDNDGEREHLETILSNSDLVFNQKPEDKLNYIENRQNKHQETVMMFGDGLNDAGALVQSNVGVAVSENINVFSPACDAIIDASVFHKIPLFVQLSKRSLFIIKLSFGFSFIYNIIGLYFAVTGQLSPIIAAILMPLSSISVVAFVTILTNLQGRKLSSLGD